MDRREFLTAHGPTPPRWHAACRHPVCSARGCVPRRPKSRGNSRLAGPCGRPPGTRGISAMRSGREVLLVGSHTWNSLVDMGRSDPPEAFDFDAYLDFLGRYGHNFIRLWAWDSTTWDTRANGRLGKDFIHHAAPLPWLRTGPGMALDGKPKFDLKQFDPAYFDRLRQRVSAAGRRGIYVSVMLFEGWGMFHGNRRRGTKEEWAWRSHPFHPDNNSSGIDAGGKVHQPRQPSRERDPSRVRPQGGRHGQ